MSSILFSFVAAFLFSLNLQTASPATVQSGDDYVKNLKSTPDLTSSEWRHVVEADRSEGEFAQEIYTNDKYQVVAFLRVRNSSGVRQELFMEFGTKDVARAALKVNGKWHLGKEPFFVRPEFKKEKALNYESARDANGVLLSVTVTLDTLDGLKTLKVEAPK